MEGEIQTQADPSYSFNLHKYGMPISRKSNIITVVVIVFLFIFYKSLFPQINELVFWTFCLIVFIVMRKFFVDSEHKELVPVGFHDGALFFPKCIFRDREPRIVPINEITNVIVTKVQHKIIGNYTWRLKIESSRYEVFSVYWFFTDIDSIIELIKECKVIVNEEFEYLVILYFMIAVLIGIYVLYQIIGNFVAI